MEKRNKTIERYKILLSIMRDLLFEFEFKVVFYTNEIVRIEKERAHIESRYEKYLKSEKSEE